MNMEALEKKLVIEKQDFVKVQTFAGEFFIENIGRYWEWNLLFRNMFEDLFFSFFIVMCDAIVD